MKTRRYVDSETFALIHMMKNQGSSKAQIARGLDFSEATVYNVLCANSLDEYHEKLREKYHANYKPKSRKVTPKETPKESVKVKIVKRRINPEKPDDNKEVVNALAIVFAELKIINARLESIENNTLKPKRKLFHR